MYMLLCSTGVSHYTYRVTVKQERMSSATHMLVVLRYFDYNDESVHVCTSPPPILSDGKMGMHAPSHCHQICTGWRCMHLAFPLMPLFVWCTLLHQGADDLHVPWMANYSIIIYYLLFIIFFLILRWWYTTLKCSMKCTFEHLHLANNHVWPECKMPIRAVCVGKYLKDAPLGRDIICYDCAEDLKEDLAEKGTFPTMTRTRQN